MSSLLLTLVWFVLIGFATSRVVAIRPGGTHTERMAELFLVGLGIAGSLLFILAAIGMPLNRVTFALPAVAALAALALSGRRFPVAEDATRRLEIAAPRTAVSPARDPFATIVMAVPVIAIVANCAVIPLRDYDGRVFWLLKAKAIVHEQSITGPFFQGETSRHPHSEYPLLLPLDAASIFNLTGSDDDRSVRWIYALSAISLLLILRRELHAIAGRSGDWIAAVLAWLPQLSIQVEGGATSAYADIPLTAFFALAVTRLVRFVNRDPFDSVFSLALLFLVLTKNEGLALAAVLLAVLVGTALTQKRMRTVSWRVAIPLTIGCSALFFWRTRIPNVHDENYALLLRTLPQQMANLPIAARELFARCADFDAWGFFWLAVAACAVLALFRDNTRKQSLVVLAVALPALAIYVATYAVTNWILADLARASANRLLMHVLPAASILVASAIAPRRELPNESLQ